MNKRIICKWALKAVAYAAGAFLATRVVKGLMYEDEDEFESLDAYMDDMSDAGIDSLVEEIPEA